MDISRIGWAERIVSCLLGSHPPRGRAATAGLSAVVALLAAPPALGQSVVYVDVNAAGPVHDGSSWCSAYTALQDALANARASAVLITEILIADGVYKPDQGANQVPGDREASFQLVNGVAVRGGYAGCGAPNPDERNIALYATILSGDLSGDDGPHFANNEENSYHVVTGSGTDATAVLDGFTITGGNADGDPSFDLDRGGGMFIDAGANSTIADCTFTGNSGSLVGGGMCSYGSPRLTNCTFSSNSAGSGGGLYNDDENPKLTNCTFRGNSATWYGGGMYNVGGSPTVADSTFDGNRADYGGGMYNWDGNPTLTNCTFSGNSAGDQGGRISEIQRAPTLANCMFSEYWSSGGGGMYNRWGNPMLMSCTFSGNSAYIVGGGMYNRGRPTLTNCAFNGNRANYGGGMYDDALAMLTNCTFSGNSADSIGGMLGGRTVTNCILWGNTHAGGVRDQWAQISNMDGVTYSCVEGWEGVGIGNTGADPLFVDPGYWNDNGMPDDPDDDFWVDGDYHLQAGSPCIDAGDNAAFPPSVLTDLDGNPRFVDDPLAPDIGSGTPPIVDMGTYERQIALATLLDILPTHCPNRISVKSRRPVPMAVVGTDTFDVMQIDPDSLVLTRADGIGGSVRPVMRKPGRGITIKDVATPFDGDLCGCHKRHGDGIDDLVAMFSMGDMADILQLDSASKGESVILTISGMLSDGSPFDASDCILITGRRESPAQKPLPVRRTSG